MRYVLIFFRDTLSGTTYFAVSLVCFILICFCIYFFKKVSLSEKKLLEKEMESKVVLVDSTGTNKNIEVSFADEVDTGSQTITNVTSVLANQDIYANDAGEEVSVENSEVAPDTEVLEDTVVEKAPVMINPDEVALVSSDMNVIGSSEKMASITGDGTVANTVSPVVSIDVNASNPVATGVIAISSVPTTVNTTATVPASQDDITVV